jgi:hypothetical protein
MRIAGENVNCELTAGGNWQISSPQLKETWQLSELQEWWLLSVGNVPQINFSANEALRFLRSRHRLLEPFSE